MSPVKVLIVEDEVIIAHNLARTLSKLGYHVVGLVTSGEEAIQAAGQNLPDIIVMDIVIQGQLNGIEAADKITKMCEIPIIYTTAYTDDNILQKVRHVGGYGFLIKPYNKKQLHAAIQLALGQQHRFMESRHQLKDQKKPSLLSKQDILALGQQLFSCSHSHWLVITTLIIQIPLEELNITRPSREYSTQMMILIRKLLSLMDEQDIVGRLNETDFILMSYLRTPTDALTWSDDLKVNLSQVIPDFFGIAASERVGIAHSKPADCDLKTVINRAYNDIEQIILHSC